eukprot:XP_011617921.1 PREDICTED: snRNA-activating protein complex subunit 4 isoform X2 [Takifugu rubripes]
MKEIVFKERREEIRSAEDMSLSVLARRDLIQQQVQELEQSLSLTHTDLELLSSETDEGTDDESDGGTQSVAVLLAERDKIQKEIQNLEDVLGPHSPVCVSDADRSSSSDESELGLALTVESCLQVNLVYQQVVQEALEKLETLLRQNEKQQKEVVSQLSGPIKEPHREPCPTSSYQIPINMFLGRFLKPYFKDKLTGLGPPANQESKEKSSRMTGCLDNKKVKRWESWQKTLLIHSVSRDGLRRQIQPKLSKVDYLSQKLLSACGSEKQQLREQIDGLEREIELLREKKEGELIGDRYEDLDWQKISNIDFEGTRDAEDLRCFWQNFLHPSINKSGWSQEEVDTLKQLSRKYEERHWETIAAELGTGRTGFMCLQTYQRFASDSLKRCSWTTAEDTLLKELVEKMRIGNFIPYTQMSYFMEGRDPAQLIYRWNNVLDPRLRKGPWTPEEDQLLLRAVSRYGEKDWWKIRMEVPGRHDGACRDRYFESLKAETRKGAFDKQETESLRKLVEKHGVGRWAKIAAEIPHRTDAQCLREWRKLNRIPLCPTKKKKKVSKPAKIKRYRSNAPAQKISKRQTKLDKDMEKEIREEEEMIVEYMDSDEEGKKKRKKLKAVMDQSSSVEVEKEVKEEKKEVMYSFPPMPEWTPAENPPAFTVLQFRPAEFPSPYQAQDTKNIRSTILGQYGRSVIIGPPPVEQRLEKFFNTSTLMVTSDQLQAHLSHQADKFRPAVKVPPNTMPRSTHRRMDYELKASVTPWIGNLMIPSRSTVTTAAKLREQGQKKVLSSTAIFLLFLQTMNVDSVGCKEIIKKRKSEMIFPPSPVLSSQLKDPKTLAGMLQRRRQKQRLLDFQIQPSLHLEQVQQQQQKQLLHPSPCHQPTTAVPPQASSLQGLTATHQNHSGTVRQLPPQMNPVLPRAVFIPPSSVPSLQLLTPTFITPPTSSPSVIMAFPFPLSPRPIGPPVSALLVSGKTSASASASPDLRVSSPLIDTGPDTHKVVSLCMLPPSAAPVRQNAVPDHKPACSDTTLSQAQEHLAPPQPILPTAASSLTSPFHDHNYTADLNAAPTGNFDSRMRKQRGKESNRTSSSDGQHGVETGQSVGRFLEADCKPASVVVGKRLRKLSQRAIAFQEASKAKAERKKKRSSPSCKNHHHFCSPDRFLLPRLGGRADQTVSVMGTALMEMSPLLGLPFTLVQKDSDLPSVIHPATAGPQPPYLKLSSPLNPTPLPSRSILYPVQIPASPPLVFTTPSHHKKMPLPFKLNFDPSLIFSHSHGAVGDWLSDRRGVVVPGVDVALPYLPPFVSNLTTLSVLLHAKNSLTKSSLRLLSQVLETRHPQTKPKPCSTTTVTTQPPDLPASAAEPTSAPSMSPTLQRGALEEAGLVAAVRQLVAERFSSNPAYHLLKARFLSCFTVPALLASIQPVTETTVLQHTSQEEEEEEEEEEEQQQLKKIYETGKRERAERSSLQLQGSGAPANHFSGITSTLSIQSETELNLPRLAENCDLQCPG